MSNNQKQIYAWYGDNDWAISKQIQKWIEVFDKKFGSLNIVKVDFEDKTSKDRLEQTLKNAMQVDSLFGQNKLIILKNIFSSKLDKNIEKLIIESMEKLPDSFFIIISQKGKIDNRSKLAKSLKSLMQAGKAEIKEHKKPKGGQLMPWINEQAKKQDASMSFGAVNRLIVLVGDNLWQIEAEIKKLASYCKGREIAESDVDQLVIGRFNDDIFQFVDAVSLKNKARSSQLLSDQLSSGANQFYLLTMLTRQFRNILLIKDLKDRREVNSSGEAAKVLKMHPFVVQKTWGQADRFGREEIEKIYERLLAIEKKFKSTSWSPQLLFDLFVIGL